MFIYQVEAKEAGMTDSVFFSSWNKAKDYSKRYMALRVQTEDAEWEITSDERGFFVAEYEEGIDVNSIAVYKVKVH